MAHPVVYEPTRGLYGYRLGRGVPEPVPVIQRGGMRYKATAWFDDGLFEATSEGWRFVRSATPEDNRPPRMAELFNWSFG